MGRDFVEDVEIVERRIEGEDAGVVSGDVQAGVAFVNGAEEAAEIRINGQDIKASSASFGSALPEANGRSFWRFRDR